MKNQVPCRGCSTTNEEAYVELRNDAYGYATGHYCEDCYENNYPYRKDRYYDYLDAGERLEDDY
jgi:hypothetical protein